MGGFPNVVKSIYGKEIVHDDNCPCKEVANQIVQELSQYEHTMYELFENSTDKTQKIQYIQDAYKAKFWEENMVILLLDNMQTSSSFCDGCDQVIDKYIMSPMYILCGVDERSKDAETKEMLEPLFTIAKNFTKQIKLITKRITEIAGDSDSDSDSDSSSDV
jgi:hypothetical protein